MATVDKRRLAALLAMTTSDHDGEALNAMRMANRLLASASVTWQDVLGITTTPSPDPQRATRRSGRGTRQYGMRASQKRKEDTRRHREPEIPGWLAELTSLRHDLGTMMMIATMNTHWQKHRWLSGAQYDMLCNLVNTGRRR